MPRYTEEQRAVLTAAALIRRRANKDARAARPKKIIPIRSDKPDGALRERRPRERDPKYLQWVRRQICTFCALRGIIRAATDACHVRAGFPEAGWSATGGGEKPSDRRTWPGCRACHDAERDRRSERAYWSDSGLYPPAFCASLIRSYEAGLDGPEVVLRAIQEGRR